MITAMMEMEIVTMVAVQCARPHDDALRPQPDHVIIIMIFDHQDVSLFLILPNDPLLNDNLVTM